MQPLKVNLISIQLKWFNWILPKLLNKSIWNALFYIIRFLHTPTKKWKENLITWSLFDLPLKTILLLSSPINKTHKKSSFQKCSKLHPEGVKKPKLLFNIFLYSYLTYIALSPTMLKCSYPMTEKHGILISKLIYSSYNLLILSELASTVRFEFRKQKEVRWR